MKTSKSGSEVKKLGRPAKATVPDESPPKLRGRNSPSRSPARISRKKSPAPKAAPPTGRKSPARKSPARKSPARKSPARKSPSRNAKEIEEPSKSPSRRPAIKSEKNYADKSINLMSARVDIARISRPSKKSYEYVPKVDADVEVVNGTDFVSVVRDGLRKRQDSKASEEPIGRVSARRSTRLQETTDNFEKLQSLAQSTKLPKSDILFENFSDSENFSDDELTVPKRQISVTRTLATPIREVSVPPEASEFGGWVGVLFQMVFTPLFILGVNLSCSSTQCNFTSWPKLPSFNKLDNWINLKSLLIYTSFILIQVLVSFIPILGKKVSLPGGHNIFTANGTFSVFVTLFVIMGLEYVDIPAISLIHTQYIPLFVTAVLFGIITSVGLFIRSKNIPSSERNIHGNSGSTLYDFWMGREVNPCLFGKFQVKLIFMRAALIGAVLFNVVSLYRGIQTKNFPIISTETAGEIETYQQIIQSVSVSPTLVVFASMQIFYFLHAISREASIISTFEYQYEGTGLMLALGYSVYPFTTMSITRYILQHKVVLPNIALAIVTAVYLGAFYIYHASNAQKSAYRENPNDPKLSHLDSLPTFQGKRLLISGWWGVVRHPNYLGDILLHLCWGSAALTAPPVLFILATVGFLAHRAARDGQRCKRRYGAAWERYCRRVPYVLVPKLY